MFEFIIISVSSHTVSEAMPLFGTTLNWNSLICIAHQPSLSGDVPWMSVTTNLKY